MEKRGRKNVEKCREKMSQGDSWRYEIAKGSARLYVPEAALVSDLVKLGVRCASG